MQETWVRSLGLEDSLVKEVATCSSILAKRDPWTEEPGGLQSLGSQIVGHDVGQHNTHTHTHTHTVSFLANTVMCSCIKMLCSFILFFFCWSIVALQCCADFYCIAQ